MGFKGGGVQIDPPPLAYPSSDRVKEIESLPQTRIFIIFALQPNIVNLRYFKLCVLLDQII